MNKELQKVIAIQDESSHWYLIPNWMETDFRSLEHKYLQTEDEDIIEEFERKFGEYRTGGDLNNIQLYAEI